MLANSVVLIGTIGIVLGSVDRYGRGNREEGKTDTGVIAQGAICSFAPWAVS
jgi:hypothetical protein